METFSALLALCAGNSPVIGEFPSQRPVPWCFVVFFDLRLNKRLSKQSGHRWYETPSRSLWHHYNAERFSVYMYIYMRNFDMLWWKIPSGNIWWQHLSWGSSGARLHSNVVNEYKSAVISSHAQDRPSSDTPSSHDMFPRSSHQTW